MNRHWRPLAIIAIAGFLWPALSLSMEPNWPDQMVIGTASPGGTYYVYGEGLAKILTRDLGLPVVPLATEGPTQNIELRGQTIKQGQYVYLLYFAANRDEECWTDPDTFDITRPPEPAVLSFGFGQHACIGAALARLEGRVFLEEMLTRFSSVTLAGEPKRVDSPLQHGWHVLPVTFER